MVELGDMYFNIWFVDDVVQLFRELIKLMLVDAKVVYAELADLKTSMVWNGLGYYQ